MCTLMTTSGSVANAASIGAVVRATVEVDDSVTFSVSGSELTIT